MEAFSEMMKQMGPMFWVLPVFILVGVVMMVVSLTSRSKRRNNYLEKYPNAVKVYAKTTNVVVANSQVVIGLVDGETPAYFTGGTYVKPGKSVLTVRFDSSRVGVFYKSVNKTTDYVEVEVNLEEGKEYELSFDKKEQQFKIEEK